MKDYERLTIRNNGVIDTNCRNCKQCEKVGRKYICNDMTACDEEIINRLAELEDDLESGKMIRLPCKVGDTVYWLFTTNIQKEIYEVVISEFRYTSKSLDICLSNKDFMGYRYVTPKDIGETLFLTKAEAEKKLKELKGE